MNVQRTIAVSELKAKLLHVVRTVERGHAYTVTRGGKTVAQLIPFGSAALPVMGFARVAIVGDIIAPLDVEWSFDDENVRRRRARRKGRG